MTVDDSGRVVAGPEWDWLVVKVDGDDLTVHETTASEFGDPADKEDNGIGASGFHVAAHPEHLGCSLPQRGRGIKNFARCPIPRLFWFTQVKVYSWETHLTAYTSLVDLGPSLYRKDGTRIEHGIDLTIGTVKALGLTVRQGLYRVSFRIIGGAKQAGLHIEGGDPTS